MSSIRKRHARILLNQAVQRGEITRPPFCSMCGGEADVHGHHHDYRKPLDVIWLCASCHGLAHASDPAGLPQYVAVPRECGGMEMLQRALLGKEQYVELLQRESEKVDADYAELKELQGWCFDKFGRAPEIPELLVPEEA